MIIEPDVPLHRLVLSLSEAMDNVNPGVADHQLRVAHISVRIGRLMGFRGQRLQDLFHAAALHDIGLIRAENRIRCVDQNVLEGVEWHGEVGYQLLKDNELFASAAEIVRFHHTAWDRGRGVECNGERVPLGSHIILLADFVERRLDEYTNPVLQGPIIVDEIAAEAGEQFHPDCVEALRKVADHESFWLDLTSKRLYSILARDVDWPTLTVSPDVVRSIAHIFGRVVDSLSPWTAAHSAGVAATAVTLAELLNFSPREQTLMWAAGYLHDVGKTIIPARILDKPGEPTASEWALIRGHTYHTFRILDTIGGMPQICEWAAFHHELLDGSGYPFGHDRTTMTLGARIMAVADTFTAVTEDRPYRKGMAPERVMRILTRLADEGKFDAQVVAVVRENFDEVNTRRITHQQTYVTKQAQLAELMGTELVAPAAR